MFIEATIESVLGQDYPRLEYVVVDGGSTDGTLHILRRYDGRLRWLSEPDGGQAAAVNKGIALTSGEIVGWLNSDDLYTPGAIAAMVRPFEERADLALVYGDAALVDTGGHFRQTLDFVRAFDYARLLEEDFIVQPAAFFRRSAFDAVGGLDESLHWSMDYDLWLKLGRRFPALHLTERLAHYRWTGQNKTATGSLDRLKELERVGQRHGAGGLPVGFRLEHLWVCAREARRAAAAGLPGAALGLLLRGVGGLALSPRAWRWVFESKLRRAFSSPGRR